MTRKTVVAWAVVSVITVVAPLAAQTALPPRDRAAVAPVAGTSRIGGRVVQADTGAPVRRALVTLAGESSVRREVTTDAEGRYEFSELPAGRFIVTAAKGGYLTLQYGQRRPFEPGRAVSLGEDQALGEVDLALPRAGVIAGRVTDERGDPIAGAEVRVERYQYGPDGQRQLTLAPTGAARTNDLGEFRAFGLMPGEYVVQASVRQMPALPGLPQAGPQQGPLPTYYPGTANVVEAQSVMVGLGEESWLQFGLLRGRLSRISGTIVDASGRPVAGANLMLATPTNNSIGASGRGSGSSAADGSFAIANVAPGTHFVQARLQAGPGGPGVSEFANVPVSVSGDDITNLLITLGPAATASGRVEWEGEAPRTGGPAGTPLRVTASAADGRPMMVGTVGMADDPAASGTVGPDGRFRIAALLGHVRFAATGMPTLWTLKAVVVDGVDITDTGTDAAGIGGDTQVRVVLTDRITDVSGSVRDAGGSSVPEYVVIVLPEQPMAPPAAARHTRTVRPDQDGTFRLRALPPGRYVAAAVDALEQGSEWDPAFQSIVRASSPRRFTLDEGQSLTLDLDLMR